MRSDALAVLDGLARMYRAFFDQHSLRSGGSQPPPDCIAQIGMPPVPYVYHPLFASPDSDSDGDGDGDGEGDRTLVGIEADGMEKGLRDDAIDRGRLLVDMTGDKPVNRILPSPTVALLPPQDVHVGSP